MTDPLPPDPDSMNAMRAAWAHSALSAFVKACSTEWEDALADLLCDLIHLADRDEQLDFEQALERARSHYEAETDAASL